MSGSMVLVLLGVIGDVGAVGQLVVVDGMVGCRSVGELVDDGRGQRLDGQSSVGCQGQAGEHDDRGVGRGLRRNWLL